MGVAWWAHVAGDGLRVGMVTQRKKGHGISAVAYPGVVRETRLGSHQMAADRSSPIAFTGWVIPQRSSRAEVAGQRDIDVIRIGVSPKLGHRIGLWSEIDLLGRTWDVVTPAAYHHGTPRTRHYSLDLRSRGDARWDASING